MKTELLTEKGTLRLKGLLMVSAAALVLTTTPAWIPGMAAAISSSVAATALPSASVEDGISAAISVI